MNKHNCTAGRRPICGPAGRSVYAVATCIDDTAVLESHLVVVNYCL